MSRKKFKRSVSIFAIASVALVGMIVAIGVLSSRSAKDFSVNSAGNSYLRQMISSSSVSGNGTLITISSCAELKNISDPKAYYVLAGDLSCDLSAPLFAKIPFTGTFDGTGNYLNLTINSTGNAGLFDIFSGILINLNIYGVIHGSNLAGAFGAQIQGGLIQSCGSYASVTSAGKSGMAGAGGFFGYANSLDLIRFQGCVSQGFVMSNGSLANYASGYIGYFVLLANVSNDIVFDNCLSIPISLHGDINLTDPFGNSYNNSFICSNTDFCSVLMNCINSYYNEMFSSSLCSATSAQNNELTCPTIIFNNGATFFFSCTGGSTSGNSVKPVFPILNTCAQANKPCLFFCIEGRVCVNGRCLPAPFVACPACPENSTCVSGVCVQGGPFIPILDSPTTPEDCIGGCPIGSNCINGQCMPNNTIIPPMESCTDDLGCPLGFFCDNGTCATSGCLGGCPAGSNCVNAQCVPTHPIIIPPLEPVECLKDMDCPSGFVCDNSSCVSSNCSNEICVGGCANGTVCSNGTCIPENSDLNCVDGCAEGLRCVNGQCIPANPTDACGGCRPGSQCVNGNCIPFGNPLDSCPAGCPEGTECIDGKCWTMTPEGDCSELCQTGHHCVNGECVPY